MASSGGKKRQKWKSLDVEKIIDSNPKFNWAEEVDREFNVDSLDYVARKSVVLPTAPRASRGTTIDETKIPTIGPFQAYLSNIPYDVNEDELANFFVDLQIKSVKLPREERGGNRAKGYGYVEFEDRASLISALNYGETTIKGRPIRIELATNLDSGGRGGRGGSRGSRNDLGPRDPIGPDRTSGNWRSGPRVEEEEGRGGFERREYGGGRRDFGGFSRGFDRDERGSSFGREDRGGGFSRGFDRDDRGGSSFGRDDRYSRDDRGSSDRGFGSRDGGGFGERGGFRDRGGFNRDDDRGRFRDGGDRYGRDDRGGGFGGGRYEDRKDDRFGPKREDRTDSLPRAGGDTKVRTKLVLTRRVEPVQSEVSAGSQAIFGGAKPVDTAAREREIEERLAKREEGFDARAPRPPPPAVRKEREREVVKEKRGDGNWRDDKRVEPAPPPKENAWSHRTSNSSVNNGRSSPDDAQPENYARSGKSEEDYDGKSEEGSSDDRRQESKRSDDPWGKGGNHQKGGGGDKSRGRDTDRQSNKQREPRRESGDDVTRMPKVQETTTPNFAGENKFSSLVADDGYVD